MLKRSAWIGGAVTLLIALIVIAPAALIPMLLSSPHVRLEHAQGTVWRGDAETFINNQHIGELSWEVKPLELIEGRLTVDLTLERDGVSIAGVSTSNADGHEISLSGVIGSRLVNVFTLAYDIRMSGELTINDVKLRVDDQKKVESAEGTVSWDGGPVRFKLANVVHEVTLDPVLGTLSQGSSFVELTVQRLRAQKPVLAFRIDPETGWVHLRAFPAFLEFANVPPNYLMQDSDFIFEVSQKLF
ncbi:MAG: type II secretion system protein N [Gammaproteobacteria bacterium]|nr:type II secretion system protein N [Gammaproteobacteria bacterium]